MIICIIETSISIENMHLVKKNKETRPLSMVVQRSKKRYSFLILKNDTPIFISTSDHFKFKNLKLIYSGLYSCLEETNLFDILKSIKIQNEYLDKQKINFVLLVLIKITKY